MLKFEQIPNQEQNEILETVKQTAEKLADLGSKVVEFNGGEMPKTSDEAMKIAQENGIEYKIAA